MPGIFGVIDLSKRKDVVRARELQGIVERMARAMRYESRYVVNFASGGSVHAGYCGETSHVSPRSNPHMSSQSLLVVVAGEPTTTTRGRQPSAADVAAVGPGAEIVRRAWAAHGPQAPSVLRGPYSAVINDQASGECLLSTDRYGVERLFVSIRQDAVYFASEAKAILAVSEELRYFHPLGVAQWLALGCTVGKTSLFRGIDVLEGGTCLTIRSGYVQLRRYFSAVSMEETPQASGGEFIDGFKGSLAAAVSAIATADSPVAMSLTAGLDSRMVMASLDASPGAVPCYTFGSVFRDTVDVATARKIAAICGQSHQVLRLDGEFLRDVPSLLDQAVYCSDGYLGLSGAAELYLNRLARSVSTVRLTGNWGGEVMRGVRAFKCLLPGGGFINASVLGMIAECERAFRMEATMDPLSFALSRQIPDQGYGRYAIERSQVSIRTPFLAADVVDWLYRAPQAVRQAESTAEAVISRRPALLAVPTDTGRLGLGFAPMKKVRRLYRRVVAKAEYLTSHGAPDWLAAASALLPPAMLETPFLGRDKFQHFRFWSRRNLAGYIQDAVAGARSGALGEFVDMRRVEEMVALHIAGRRNYLDGLDKVLTLASAERTLLKGGWAQ